MDENRHNTAVHIQVLLGYLEHVAFPPGDGRHHSITLGQKDGKEVLCLNLWLVNEPNARVLHLEGDDLNKWGHELVPVIRALLGLTQSGDLAHSGERPPCKR
jgi:hypothetical protein